MLLKKCHTKLMTKFGKIMRGSMLFLTTDAWKNINSDSVVSYMAVSPACSLFLESILTGQQGHDHKFIDKNIA